MSQPEDLKNKGLQEYRADDLDGAATAFEQAAAAYAAAGQADMAAEMRNNIAVVRLAQRDWPGALSAGAGTPELFRGRGDKLREAQALANLAAAHEGAGDLAAAASLYEQAIEGFTEIGERENRGACWKALSGIQVKQDKKLQAMASMQAGLNLSENLSAREKTLQGVLNQAMKMIGPR